MPLRRSHLLRLAACASICGATILLPQAHAATSTTLTACVAKSNGIARIVAAPSACIAALETVVQFNQTGPAGPSGAPGPAGPAGPSGPTGPQGPAGSAVTNYSVSFTVPSGASGGIAYEIPILGGNVSPGSMPVTEGSTPSAYIASPNSCTVTKVTASQLYASGTSQMDVYLLYRMQNFPANYLFSLCSVSAAGVDNPSSCTATPNFAVQSQWLLAYYLAFPNAQDFAGRTLFLTATCQ